MHRFHQPIETEILSKSIFASLQQEHFLFPIASIKAAAGLLAFLCLILSRKAAADNRDTAVDTTNAWAENAAKI